MTIPSPAVYRGAHLLGLGGYNRLNTHHVASWTVVRQGIPTTTKE